MPTEIPEWLGAGLLGLLGTVLIVGGAIVGHLLSARSQKRAATVQSEATQASRENALIDQLQEELKGYRETADKRAVEQDKRMNALEERNGILIDRNDRYRDLLHKHRAHIWDALPPPPPAWPDDLPR